MQCLVAHFGQSGLAARAVRVMSALANLNSWRTPLVGQKILSCVLRVESDSEPIMYLLCWSARKTSESFRPVTIN